MITVTLLSSGQKPWPQGMPLQLVSEKGDVLSSAQTDAMGVAAFDFDPPRASKLFIRLDLESLSKTDHTQE